jgi:hypothetical protein
MLSQARSVGRSAVVLAVRAIGSSGAAAFTFGAESESVGLTFGAESESGEPRPPHPPADAPSQWYAWTTA